MNQLENRNRARAVHQLHTKESQPKDTRPDSSSKTRRRVAWSTVIACVFVLGFGAGFARDWWLPYMWSGAGAIVTDGQREAHTPPDDGGERHTGQSHAGHDDKTSLELSETGRKNVGLTLLTVEPRDFDRTINVPAMIVERAGRTRLKVSAPMTGIVSRVYPIRGEAVKPGQPLFSLRLTHEDLVETQSKFLQTVEQLDVIKREIARLEKVTSSGAIAGKRLLERQYEQQQTEALLHAQRQALVLHGLTEKQVDSICETRRLLQDVTVVAPEPTDCEARGQHDEYLQVAELSVEPGEHVGAGTGLCTLTDHCELYVEGKAFEEDAEELNRVANAGASITAVIEGNGKGPRTISGLTLLYVESEVEVASRALRFYVRLANELVRNEEGADGHRFIGWRYKPGQRVQLSVPVERWQNRIVLPVDAVVKEGAEWLVFQQNGDHFDRKSVHVEYRNQRWALIESDGTLFPGDVVVASGAYQMHLALKNKAGGGVDPHAGHNH